MKSCPLIIDNPELILEWDYLKNEKMVFYLIN